MEPLGPRVLPFMELVSVCRTITPDCQMCVWGRGGEDKIYIRRPKLRSRAFSPITTLKDYERYLIIYTFAKLGKNSESHPSDRKRWYLNRGGGLTVTTHTVGWTNVDSVQIRRTRQTVSMMETIKESTFSFFTDGLFFTQITFDKWQSNSSKGKGEKTFSDYTERVCLPFFVEVNFYAPRQRML